MTWRGLQAVVAAQLRVDLAHRRLHGGRARGGQRMIRIAGHAQDAVFLGVHAQAHAALRPAAQQLDGLTVCPGWALSTPETGSMRNSGVNELPRTACAVGAPAVLRARP